MCLYQTCEGCAHLCTEDAGKKEGKAYTFFICDLGSFENRPRPVIEHVPEVFGKMSVPIPSWCKKGIGYVLGKDGCLRQKGEAHGQENRN